ncbi:MAG: Ralstonia phage [Pseudomonadota bacterium]|jgi:hypothetical protein
MSEVIERPQAELATQEIRDRIAHFEAAMGTVEHCGPEGFDTEHVFTPGVYIRTIRIPAGTVLVGRIHKEEHLNLLQAGTITDFSQDGLCTYSAPAMLVGSKGVKRVGYAHTDVIWTTVHHNPDNVTDPEKILDVITVPSYEDLV